MTLWHQTGDAPCHVSFEDGEPLVPANEPRGIKKTQAVRKSGGYLDDGFIEYLRQLQLEYIKRCGLTSTSSPLSP